VPTPAADALPFRLVDGWPVELPGCVVTIRETGIVLGSLLSQDQEWQVMREQPVLSLRIDDHRLSEGFEVPMEPVLVPAHVLVGGRLLSEWAENIHGSIGRLLLWDVGRRWWMAQDADLELVVTCAPLGMFAPISEALSWLAFGTAEGRKEVGELRRRYGVTWPE
jgi:hypothetical protein